jgi:hypothetical protein
LLGHIALLFSGSGGRKILIRGKTRFLQKREGQSHIEKQRKPLKFGIEFLLDLGSNLRSEI